MIIEILSYNIKVSIEDKNKKEMDKNEIKKL